jgi:hypothetical protein
MSVIVFDISPGDVVVIQNEERLASTKERVDDRFLPELGLQVVEPELEE